MTGARHSRKRAAFAAPQRGPLMGGREEKLLLPHAGDRSTPFV
jgi:hypothetical protein